MTAERVAPARTKPWPAARRGRTGVSKRASSGEPPRIRAHGQASSGGRELRLRFPTVVDACDGLDRVPLQHHFARQLLDADADGLFARLRRAGVANDVVSEDQVPRFAPDADPGRFVLVTIVLDKIVFQPIAVSGHALGFISKKHSVLAVESHLVFLEEIVRVLVPDRDSEAAVVFQDVFLEESMPHAPAEEEPVFAVAPGNALAHHRPLGTAAGVDAQAGVAFADTTLDQDIVGLLKADAVAVIIADQTVLDHGSETAVEKDAAAPAAVKGDVLLLVAVDDQVFHARAFDVATADDGKHRGGPGLGGHHAIGVQRRVEGEGVAALAGDAGNRGVEPAGMGVPAGDTITAIENLRLRHGDLFLFVLPIRRRGGGRRPGGVLRPGGGR